MHVPLFLCLFSSKQTTVLLIVQREAHALRCIQWPDRKRHHMQFYTARPTASVFLFWVYS